MNDHYFAFTDSQTRLFFCTLQIFIINQIASSFVRQIQEDGISHEAVWRKKINCPTAL